MVIVSFARSLGREIGAGSFAAGSLLLFMVVIIPARLSARFALKPP